MNPNTPVILHGTSIDLATARRVAAAAESVAAANGWTMAIAVVDVGAHLLVLSRMDHTQIGSIAIAQAKAASAVRFKRATKVFEDALTSGGINLRVLSTEGAIPLEGGIPLVRDGRLVGAIGVSGMQSMQDGQCAAAGACALDG